MRGIVWFREDLRLVDNTALYQAGALSDEGVIGIYFIDQAMWKAHQVADCRIEFIFRGLQLLQTALEKLAIPLLIIKVRATKHIAEKLVDIMKKTQSQALFFNRQYEFDEAQRDQLVQAYLEKNQFTCYTYHDQTILPPGTVLTKEGKFFNIFTAYKRAWYVKFSQLNSYSLLPAPKKQRKQAIDSTVIPARSMSAQLTEIMEQWPAGEREANKRLTSFINDKVCAYHERRDFPFIEGTSKLSPYLASGMISARSCFAAALMANQGELATGNQGAVTWMNELIWRDFYKHLLVAAPRVSMNKPYKLETERLHWKFNEKKYLAWQEGRTGFPLIDAAMRQLNLTGWMHNRLRMVVAMFFTKNLFFDWRLGESYFMQHLIDGDFSANNGGWQWSASTGTDAVPYFRVFNPLRQSERFDAKGDFIRQYCPELAVLDDYAIHAPFTRAPLLAKSLGYPAPMLDLNATRLYAIRAFKAL